MSEGIRGKGGAKSGSRMISSSNGKVVWLGSGSDSETTSSSSQRGLKRLLVRRVRSHRQQVSSTTSVRLSKTTLAMAVVVPFSFLNRFERESRHGCDVSCTKSRNAEYQLLQYPSGNHCCLRAAGAGAATRFIELGPSVRLRGDWPRLAGSEINLCRYPCLTAIDTFKRYCARPKQARLNPWLVR